jgi:hypothetical protein
MVSGVTLDLGASMAPEFFTPGKLVGRGLRHGHTLVRQVLTQSASATLSSTTHLFPLVLMSMVK